MTAFRASFADMKLVKTRGVTQLIFEIPTEEFDTAYEILGGVPLAGKERWFGIAALVAGAAAPAAGRSMANGTRAEQGNPGGRHALAPDDSNPDTEEASRDEPAPEKPRREWREMQPSAQSAMRCDQPPFWAFLREEHKQRVANKDDAATAVRRITGVNSRAHFNENHVARVAWHQLDSQFQAWQAKERVGA